MNTTSSKARMRSLSSDCQGAMMVVALLMAVFLVGLLYTLRGVGESIHYKEHIQDTADATAFTGATIHARSMNSIGMINLIQLSAVATLQTISLVNLNAASCSAGADYTSPWSECPGLHAQWQGYNGTAQSRLVPLLEIGTRVAESIRNETPDLAHQVIHYMALEDFGYPNLSAVLVRQSMPLRTADTSALCAKAYVFVTPLMQSTVPGQFLAPNVFQVQPPAQVMRGACMGADFGPQVMDPANQTGTEALQLRSLVVGDSNALSVSSRGSELPQDVQSFDGEIPDPNQAAAALSRFALAQSEYYSAWQYVNTLQNDTATLIPEENTFHLNWKARLRRLRVPVDGPTGEVGAQAAIDAWLQDELVPACLSTVCTDTSCSVCDDLAYLSTALGGAVH